MAGFIDTMRDMFAGVRADKQKTDPNSTAGMGANMGKYRAYQTDMIEQGQKPLPYKQWAASQQ